jgi:hypothetical protein
MKTIAIFLGIFMLLVRKCEAATEVAPLTITVIVTVGLLSIVGLGLILWYSGRKREYRDEDEIQLKKRPSRCTLFFFGTLFFYSN